MSTIQDAVAAYEADDFTTARAVCGELAGHPHARFILGLMESRGEGGPANPAAAAEHYRAAAEAGHPGGCYNLAALYAQGRGVPQDFAEALRWYQRAAEAGDPDGAFQVGMMCASGEGMPAPNPGEAAYWFFRAWQGGQDEAEREIVRIRADLEAAAEDGSAAAQNAIALILCFGEDDPASAAAWFEMAAAQDHPEALRMLGYLLDNGKGVPRDDARAAGLYRRAAELGDKFAQFNLAAMIEQARGGLGRDVSEAIRWFRRAARQGIADANRPLAELLAERNRDRRDANEAVQRLVTAARSADPAEKFSISAGDGSWTVVVTKQGTVVSLVGLTLDELHGLPDED